MPISVNTGSGAYAVNTSRVEKFMQAESRDQALHMGAWDKFKDLFRTGDDKKAVQIAKIYDAIVLAEPGQDQPVGMAERFKRLRDLATDESKPQFTIQSQKDDHSGRWSYSLSIGDDRIVERRGLPDTHYESFESFSNYQKYFHGVDTVAAAPQAVTDLDSSLQGVLHAMTTPGADEISVLKALADVPSQIRTPVTTSDPQEQRAILLSRGEDPAYVDHILGQAKIDPIGFGLSLARQPDMSGEGFMAPLQAALDRCVETLPRQQLLAIADFYKAHPFFADGLRQAGTLTLPDAQEALAIDSTDDPRFAGVVARAGFCDDLGKTSKLLFDAVERWLDGDVYRSYATSDSSWRVDPNTQPNPSQDVSRVLQGFIGSTQDFASTLAQTQAARLLPEPTDQSMGSAPQGDIPPWAIKA
jgi:Salmonella outer protein D